MVFVGGAVTFIKGATTFIGEGSLAIRRSFEIAVIFVGRGGSVIEGRGKASRAYIDGAYAGKASADKDYADRARVNKVFNG